MAPTHGVPLLEGLDAAQASKALYDLLLQAGAREL